jgi:nicotinate-nucleotide pyrophosphorylase (carboxylating)
MLGSPGKRLFRGTSPHEVSMLNRVFVEEELRRFLQEDLGSAIVDIRPQPPVMASITAEEDGVACGFPWLVQMLRMLTNRSEHVTTYSVPEDGARFAAGTGIAMLRVHPEVVRHGIRTGLNLVQHLSGIATLTAAAMRMVEGTDCMLLDTRKTTPGFRVFEKYAVGVGGAKNHRFGRMDGIILKKEDIRIDGSIVEAVARAKMERSHLVKIEVEVESIDELQQALALPPVDVIMLDNMTPEQVAECVRIVDRRKPLEASGVPFDRIRAYAETGVDYISTSGLIRKATPLGMSMRIESDA